MYDRTGVGQGKLESCAALFLWASMFVTIQRFSHCTGKAYFFATDDQFLDFLRSLHAAYTGTRSSSCALGCKQETRSAEESLLRLRSSLNMRGQLIDDPELAMGVTEQQESPGIVINHRSRFCFRRPPKPPAPYGRFPHPTENRSDSYVSVPKVCHYFVGKSE